MKFENQHTIVTLKMFPIEDGLPDKSYDNVFVRLRNETGVYHEVCVPYSHKWQRFNYRDYYDDPDTNPSEDCSFTNVAYWAVIKDFDGDHPEKLEVLV